MVNTKVTLCGVELDNPVIPASGTFGYGYEFARIYDINCLGTFSFKGTTLTPRYGNPTPRIAEYAGGLLNSVGLQNPGVEAVIREELPRLREQCGDRAVLRAFHFYADNDRVPQQVAALREGDFDAFLQMVTASGDSSWEYLQNVIPAGYKEHQEVGVTIAAAKHLLGGKGAVRVHGGGFAGTVQAFVPVEMLADFKANMEKILGAGRCHVLNIRNYGAVPVTPDM